MRRLYFIILFSFAGQMSFAQTLTLQQKLYYTCKLWGFVKYYHSNVSNCGVNWDSVLLHALPLVRSAPTNSEFNDAMDSILLAAGPMALSSTYFPDTLATDLKRNRDWNWMSSPVLRSDVRIQLDTIKNNFRPHTSCRMEITRPISVNIANHAGGYLNFLDDSILLNTDISTSYPDADHRQLMFFKLWNIINYFNPYNYTLDVPWDTTLYHYTYPIDTASNGNSLYFLYLNISTALNDAHVFGSIYCPAYQKPPGGYLPEIRLAYASGQYVILMSHVPGINVGDVLVSVDGFTMVQWETKLMPYYSSGNMSVFRRTMCERVLGKEGPLTETLVVQDSVGTNHTYTTTCEGPFFNPSFFNSNPYAYPNDSLDHVSWTTMPCGAGYINIGNISDAGVDSAYDVFADLPAIIVDVRNYPVSNSGFDLTEHLLSSLRLFTKFLMPDTTYPGTYYWLPQYAGFGSTHPYTGKLVILMNEQTQSAAEFDCMGLSSYSNIVKVGSQTAGADGNVTWLSPCSNMWFGWTSLGVFYGNGDSTQRIGIVPDSVVYPTAAGFRHHRDEVLEKALSIAGCTLFVPSAESNDNFNIFPNPADNTINIEANFNDELSEIEITDITGRQLLHNNIAPGTTFLHTSVDIAMLPAGLYVICIKSNHKKYFAKFAK